MFRRVAMAVAVGVCAQAQAVVVRGHVRTPLGVPVAGARVQLIAGQQSVGDTVSGPDGSYEIRSAAGGRFVLLTSAAGPAVQIGRQFYGGALDEVTIEIALEQKDVVPVDSAVSLGLTRPVAQLAERPVQVVPGDARVVDALRPSVGLNVVELGPVGAAAGLYVRGAGPETVKVTVDGVSAEDLGGGFDLSRVGAVRGVEVMAGGQPRAGEDAEGGVASVETAAGETLRPTLVYSGDYGNLGMSRNAAEGTWGRGRLDLLGSFARFDTANEEENHLRTVPFHLATVTGNVGYGVSGGTSLRVMGRREVAAGPLTVPEDFYGLVPAGKRATQDMYGSATFETRTAGGWHNALRYGLARRRGETYEFSSPATAQVVTITGANGYSATGAAIILPLPAREDVVTDRDEFTYATDYGFRRWLAARGEVQYQDKRGADIFPGVQVQVERQHVGAAGTFAGVVSRRVFYEAGGMVDHSPTYGWHGAPRLGLTWAAVKPGSKLFRGTVVHATAATGFREPAVEQTLAGVTPRSRTFDASVDQEVWARKISVRAAYFHSQFSHEYELLRVSPTVVGAGLAYRAQGVEFEVRYQPVSRALVRGGYTYLASEVEQSGAQASANPNLPGVAIGGLTALVGQRPFRRPPQTGFVAAEYTGAALTASLHATFQGKSDDSTYLVTNPSLLLPNRDLSAGWVKLDASVSYVLTRRVTVFTQMTNLTDSRGIAPIGYRSAPFGIRTGVKVRLGGD